MHSRLPMRLSLLLVLAVSMAACDSGQGDSIYDPDAPIGETPVITSISPAGVVLAGVDEIVIQGQNFSATPSQNLVYFADGAGDGAPGEVLAASPTELRVKVPNLPNTNLTVRVSVQGARNLSNAVALPLVPAFVPFGDLSAGDREEAVAVTGDGSGNLYASVTVNGGSAGIVRFGPDGVRQPYTASSFVWSDLALSPGGVLFGTRQIQILTRLPAGAAQQIIQPVLPGGTRLAATDAADDGTIWAGGSPSIYRFDLAGAAVATPFEGTVRDLLVHNGNVYVAATRSDAASGVWRLPIQANGMLGAETLIYDAVADQGPNARARAIAMAQDGTLFVGISPPQTAPNAPVANPIIEVSPSGEARPLYPGVLPSPVLALAWGQGSTLYMIRAQQVNDTTTPATINRARLYAVQTRRQGAP